MVSTQATKPSEVLKLSGEAREFVFSRGGKTFRIKIAAERLL